MMCLSNSRYSRYANCATIIIFILTLITGCDNKDFRLVKPSEADFVLMHVLNPDTDIAMILANREGEQLIVLADKTSSGQIASVTGGAFATPSGETFTYWFGNDGLPEYVVTGNWMLRLYNYTGSKVDIIGINPGGGWHHWLGVEIEGTGVGRTRKMASKGLSGLSQERPQQTLSEIGMITTYAFSGDNLYDVIWGVKDALAVAACAISAVASYFTPLALPAVTYSCASAMQVVAMDALEAGTYVEYNLDPENMPEITSFVVSSIDHDTDVLDERRELTEFQRRITLMWGANPRDLDSHLWTPPVSGSTYHVYYSNQGSENTPPYAELDVDDVTSYGPENITIKRLFAGTYYYSVYHYAGSGTITTSGANVKVLGPGGEVLQSMNVPTGSAGSNWWWNVLEIDGATSRITIINEISAYPPSGVPDSRVNWDSDKAME